MNTLLSIRSLFLAGALATGGAATAAATPDGPRDAAPTEVAASAPQSLPVARDDHAGERPERSGRTEAERARIRAIQEDARARMKALRETPIEPGRARGEARREIRREARERMREVVGPPAHATAKRHAGARNAVPSTADAAGAAVSPPDDAGGRTWAG